MQLWYSLAKVLSEQEAWKFALLHSFDLVVVMPSFVVGPCLPPQLSKTAKDIFDLLSGNPINLLFSLGMESCNVVIRNDVVTGVDIGVAGGSGMFSFGRMGYVHVDDVARAHILVYETPSAEGRYICSAQESTPQELAHYLAGRYLDLSISTK